MMNQKSNYRGGGGRGGQTSRGGYRGGSGGGQGGTYGNQYQKRQMNTKSDGFQRSGQHSQFPHEQVADGFNKNRQQQQQATRKQNAGSNKSSGESKGGGDSQTLTYGAGKQREVSVIVTTAETATVVWCQLIDEDGDKILSMTNDLSSVCPKSSPVSGTPDINKIYATKFSVDDTWYRCKIVETMQDSMYVVQYIDYGNKETKALKELVELPASLAAVKHLAERFTLHGLKDEFLPGASGFEEGVELITNLTTGKQLLGEVYNTHYIVLSFDNQDLNQQMLISGFASCRFPSRSGGQQKNKPQSDVSANKSKDSFAANLQQCPGFGIPASSNDALPMGGGFSDMPPALFGQPTPTSQVSHSNHHTTPPPLNVSLSASEVLLKEVQHLRQTQLQLEAENKELKKKLQSQETHGFSKAEVELNRTMGELLEKKKENMKLQEDLYRLVRQHKDTDLNKRVTTLLDSIHKVKLLRQQFPSDSTMDGIQAAIDMMLQSRQGFGTNPPVNHRVEEVISLYTGAQDAVKTCQDKDELKVFITKRNQLRSELYSCINAFIEEMSKLPLGDRCRDLNDAIVALETTHSKFLSGREMDNVRSMAEVVATFSNWKQAKMAAYHEVRATSDATHIAVNSALVLLTKQLSLDLDMPAEHTSPRNDLNSLLSKYEKDLQQEILETNVEESNDFQLVSEILKTLMHHMKSELQRIDKLHTLQIEYTQLKSSLEGWLEKTPDLTPLKSLRSSIKALKSQLRHRLADKADLEEGDDSNGEELSQVVEDLDQIRAQLHTAFDKEDALLANLSMVVNQHFPELCTQFPELGLDSAVGYGGLVKLGRSLEQFHTFPLEGSSKKGVLRATYGNKDVVLKEYIIEESLGLCKADFLDEALKYASIESPNLVQLQGLFFLKSERHAYIQLPYYRQCLGNLSESQTKQLSPNTRYRVIKGVLSGLKAVHDAGLVHGAVHPNNVFITDSKDGMLADYYFSPKGERSSHAQTTVKGIMFRAPECTYSKEGDMYCVGLLIVCLYQPQTAGQQPFGQMDPIIQGIVQNLLQETPMERYSATELMNESYFRETPVQCKDTQPTHEESLQNRSKSPSNKENNTTVAARLSSLQSGPSPTEADPRDSQNDPTTDFNHVTEVVNKGSDTSESAPIKAIGTVGTTDTLANGTSENLEASQAFDNMVERGNEGVNKACTDTEMIGSEEEGLTEVDGESGKVPDRDDADHELEEVQKAGSHSEAGLSDVPSLEADTLSDHGDVYPQHADIPPVDDDDL